MAGRHEKGERSERARTCAGAPVLLRVEVSVIHVTMNEVLDKCKALLARDYGARFKGLVLHGSVARNRASLSSDIDLLVLLGTPFDYFHELRHIIDLLYPLQLETDRLISAKPVALDDFERGRFQLYRNAKCEGVLV